MQEAPEISPGLLYGKDRRQNAQKQSEEFVKLCLTNTSDCANICQSPQEWWQKTEKSLKRTKKALDKRKGL